LFVPSPQSAKLSGAAERAHGAYTKEFYQVTKLPDTFREFNRLLQHWGRVLQYHPRLSGPGLPDPCRLLAAT